MLTLIVTGLLPPEAVPHILEMTLRGFDKLIDSGNLQQLPPTS